MADLRTVESTEYEALFAGLNRDDIKTFPVTVASGQNLQRGALVTFANGKVSAVSAVTDDVFGIMCDPVDATSADAPGVVYVNGDFNKAGVKVGALDVNAFIKAARNVGIFLR
jgi:hypothetical protein